MLELVRQNVATLGIWKQRFLGKFAAKKRGWPEPRLTEDAKYCEFQFGSTPQETFQFLGDWRYLLRLFELARAGGFSIVLPADLIGELELGEYKSTLPAFDIVCNKEAKANLTFTLPDSCRHSSETKVIHVYLDGAMPGSVIGTDYTRISFGVHPRIAATRAYRVLRPRLNNIKARNVRIMSAGSKGQSYDNQPILNKCLDKSASRNQLLEALELGLSDSEHTVIAEPREYYRIFGSSRNTPLNRLISIEHNRLFSEWLFTLALSDCYLCLPGRLLLSCHSVYEAMSVGTIPVLQYADWFNPRLVDGVNCFSFEGTHDLVPTIQRILDTPANQMEDMRQSVIAYYDEYLSEQALMARVQSSDSPVNFLMDSEWNTPELSTDSAIFLR